MWRDTFRDDIPFGLPQLTVHLRIDRDIMWRTPCILACRNIPHSVPHNHLAGAPHSKYAGADVPHRLAHNCAYTARIHPGNVCGEMVECILIHD